MTPATVSSRLGTFAFRDGYGTPESLTALYDYLDLHRGIDAFLNAMQGVSMYALRKGFRDQGAKDNEDCLIFSELMDAHSLFLTANCDTVYFWPWLDVSKGPMVVEVPQNVIGVFDDMWFRWICDVGVPGRDRGQGGKYLVIGPEYEGPLPENGYFVARSRTNGVGLLARAFLENNDPAPAVARIKSQLKIYPYGPGGYGT